MYHTRSKAKSLLVFVNLEKRQCSDLLLGHRCGEQHVRLSFRHLNGVGVGRQR